MSAIRKTVILPILLYVLCLGLVSTALADRTVSLKAGDRSSSIIDTLTWRREGASEIVNFPFLNPGDSALVWFKPAAHCSLIAIRFKPIDWEGNLLIDVWDARNYYPLIYSTDSTDSNGWIGTYADWIGGIWIPGDVIRHSPLGWSADDTSHHHWGPFPVTVTAAHSHSWIEIPTAAGLQGEVNLGRDPFYIGIAFYPTTGLGISAQEPYPGSTPYSFFKFYSAGHGPDGAHDGWYIHSQQLWIEAVIKYYLYTPCYISHMTIQNDTYQDGPFLIEAIIETPDVGPGPLPVFSAELVSDMNGIIDRTPMENPPAGDIFFRAEIPELAIGDTVTYWIEVTNLYGDPCQSEQVTFARIRPEHPNADMLVIWDDMYHEDMDTFLVDLFASMDKQYEYELWNVSKRNGIDASVVNWGWHYIYVSGGGCKRTIPGRDYTGNLFFEWLEAGTRECPHFLLYIDQDYFCVQEDYGCGWDEELSERDFMYDYFGVALAISDNHGTSSPGYDSVAIGEAGTEFEGIRINFQPHALYPNTYKTALLPDWLVELTDGAEQIFKYKDSEFGAGVRLDKGHYKTVYLPWPDFFAFDSLDNGDLVPRPGLTATIEKIFEWFPST